MYNIMKILRQQTALTCLVKNRSHEMLNYNGIGCTIYIPWFRGAAYAQLTCYQLLHHYNVVIRGPTQIHH